MDVDSWVIGRGFTCRYPFLKEVVSQLFRYEGRASVQVYVAEHPSQTGQHKAFIIMVVCMFGHRKTNGNREYSSITTSKYILLVTEDTGPLKSILSLSMGLVAWFILKHTHTHTHTHTHIYIYI